MSTFKIILFSLFVATQAYSQKFILDAGDSLCKYGNYYEAITEYKRYIFIKSNNKIESSIYFKISKCYRELDDIPKSIYYLDKSILNSENDSLKSERKIDKAVILLATERYDIAELILIKELHYSKYYSIKKRASFLLCIDYIFQSEWEKSQNKFQKYVDYSLDIDENLLMEINNLFLEIKSHPGKNPLKAKLLSSILPGAGQFYCGDVRDGINALAINSLTVFLALNSILNKQYLNFLPYLYIFKRYYSGNKLKAQFLCETYNEKLNNKNIRLILNKLLLIEKINK